ncbi:MAG: helix-turn-helix domain-containing protein [Candidatus Margulisbacteria bacterium]|nr:helix-turn-helix domain-containing protein [Candidatus Margulisiibacteriota bacterium]
MARYEKPHKPDKKLLLALGRRLRSLRERQGLTIEQLSAAADINFKYLQRCETGRSNPSVSILFAIASGLAVRPEKIVAGIKKSNSPFSPAPRPRSSSAKTRP